MDEDGFTNRFRCVILVVFQLLLVAFAFASENIIFGFLI